MLEPDRWIAFEALARRVLENAEPLQLTVEVRDLLSQCGNEVGISPADAADALRAVSTAKTLLGEIKRRVEDGNARLSDASYLSMKRRDAGDFIGARKPLDELLAVEIAPFYREQAAIELRELSRLEEVARTGQVDRVSNRWDQLRILGRRVQQGMGFELSNDMREFLRLTASSVAISTAEADEALATQEGAEGLLARMLERIEEGRRRIFDALDIAYDLRDAGRLEEARQKLRDLLAVEVVPRFRQMAEDHLTAWGEDPRKDEAAS